jgi:Rrf2 family nitric oxide-sensitive transcriptional repressor
MQLTLHTDYALRVLIYLSLHPDKIITIDEVTDYYNISRNHLVKVVHNLSTYAFIHTTRGKNGGMRLARPAAEINVADVVEKMEPHFDIVECFNAEKPKCTVLPICALRGVLGTARAAFIDTLRAYTLADAVQSYARPPLAQNTLLNDSV